MPSFKCKWSFYSNKVPSVSYGDVQALHVGEVYPDSL